MARLVGAGSLKLDRFSMIIYYLTKCLPFTGYILEQLVILFLTLTPRRHWLDMIYTNQPPHLANCVKNEFLMHRYLVLIKNLQRVKLILVEQGSGNPSI